MRHGRERAKRRKEKAFLPEDHVCRLPWKPSPYPFSEKHVVHVLPVFARSERSFLLLVACLSLGVAEPRALASPAGAGDPFAAEEVAPARDGPGGADGKGVPARAASALPARPGSAAVESAGADDAATPVPGTPRQSEAQRNYACDSGVLHGKPCGVSWGRLLPESLLLLSAQHGGNLWMDKDTRYNVTHGTFWGDYAYCVEHYRWSRWKDDDPFGVDYVGHPMMGSVTNSIYEQNDPKQRALSFENTHRYWMGRLRATAYSAAYSAQWKIGPLSEASVGNTGIGYYRRASDGIWTNETGMGDFFVTPVGGLAWNVGEDVIDRYLFARVRHARRNRVLLFVASFMTPTRSAANLTRLRAPYYRDEASVPER